MFGTSGDTVFRAVPWVVGWGRENQERGEVEAIGIDEIQYRRGHRYLTLADQSDAGSRRLLPVARDRTEDSRRPFLEILPKATLQSIPFVGTDLWKPSLNVVAECCGHAVQIPDRFQVMKKFGEQLDQVRATEARQMTADGDEPVWKHSRWCLLKRREKLTDKQTVKRKELLPYNLRRVRAYRMREDFPRFWQYRSPTGAGTFLDEWCTRAMRSQIDPIKQMANTLRRHRELLRNWFRAKGELSSGSVEGLNNKAQLAMKKADGFKSYETIEIALCHQLEKLPKPQRTHRSC